MRDHARPFESDALEKEKDHEHEKDHVDGPYTTFPTWSRMVLFLFGERKNAKRLSFSTFWNISCGKEHKGSRNRVGSAKRKKNGRSKPLQTNTCVLRE